MHESTFSQRSSLSGADDLSAEQLLRFYQIGPAELELIAQFGRQVLGQSDHYVDAFYRWLSQQPAYTRFFSDPATLARVKAVQAQSWHELFSGRFDDELLERRRKIGMTHARIGLPPQIYLSSMNYSFALWVEQIWGNKTDVPTVNAVAKLLHLDTAVVMETYIAQTNEIIASQRELLEMSTPVAALWTEVLLLPVVGIIDSRRAQNMMNDVLTKIGDTQARVFVLDISGVAVVDTAVANHLIKITRATKLMGCECIISGLSSAIAQTIVDLGIDVGSVRTTATLKDAVRLAFSLVDLQIRRGV
mgnify:FL=1